MSSQRSKLSEFVDGLTPVQFKATVDSRVKRAAASTVEALEKRVLLSRVEGIDVSQYQGTIDWTQVAEAGKEFVFIRATRGNDEADTRLAYNTSNAWANGLLLGVYHTARPDSSTNDAVNEANWFLDNAKQYMGSGWIRPVLSVEHGEALGASALSQWTNDFSDTVFAATGLRPIIYSNSNYAKNYLNTSVNHHDLWIARWNDNNSGNVDPQTDQPETPPGYPNPYGVWNVPVGGTPSHDSWSFWQYTSKGSVAGISGDVDLDVFQGSKALLESNFVIPLDESSFKGVSINFGPYETAVPSGYINIADQGISSVFGYEMGWSPTGVTLQHRTAGSAPDIRYRTYARPGFQGGNRNFQIAVPDGSYYVRVVAGSPDEPGATTKFWVEGTSVIDAITNSNNPFLRGSATVQVSDGYLTISSNGSTAPNSRLAFVDIVPAARAAALPSAPIAVTATVSSSTTIDVRWTDTADNEGRDPLTFSSSTWGEVGEGFRIQRRDWNGSSWGNWVPRGYARANAEHFQDTDSSFQANGQYQYRVAAVNANGFSPNASATGGVKMPSSSNRQTYSASGNPWPVGAVIQAEDFDRNGTAHSDTSTGNAGGFYRESSVDIGRIGLPPLGSPLVPREYRVGWFRPGEWLEYTVDVPTAGEYTLDFRVSAPQTGGKFRASTIVNGVETNLAAGAPGGKWDVPNTGSWDSFSTVSHTVELPAGVQIIRVYGDTKLPSHPGVMDFDWFRIAPQFDLSFESLAEADEETVGGWVQLNDNFDEGNVDSAGWPLTDAEPDALTGHRINHDDPQLRNAVITVGAGMGAGKWALRFPDRIQVWRETAPNEFVQVVSGQLSEEVTGTVQIRLKIEGVDTSTDPQDVALEAKFFPSSATSYAARPLAVDLVKLTVSGVALDADSDNDNLFGRPDLDNVEQQAGQDPSQPGKILYVNNDDSDGDFIPDLADGFNLDGIEETDDDQTLGEQFAQLTLFAMSPYNPETALYQVSYSASDPAAMTGPATPAPGHLRIWSKDGSEARNAASIANGGDFLSPGIYTGAELGFTISNREQTFWLEAVAETTDLTSRTIEFRVDPDGAAGPAGFELHKHLYVTAYDVPTVPATVTGYVWNDENDNGIRDEAFLVGTPPTIVFVVDVSGSTRVTYQGQEVGDFNSDGRPQTILDGELAAIRALNQHLIDALNFGASASVSIVVFGSRAAYLDMNPATPEREIATTPAADANQNGKPDVEEILEGIGIGAAGREQAPTMKPLSRERMK